MENFLNLMESLFLAYSPSDTLKKINSSHVNLLISFLSLAISYFALRKTTKWKDKFKEKAMSDAVEKCEKLWHCFNNMESNLDRLSINWIGSIDISPYFDKVDEYNKNEMIKNKIRLVINNVGGTRDSLIESRIRLSLLQQDFERLGFTLSRLNMKRIYGIANNIMHIESDIKSYIDSAFDYFDDKEFCSGMRYSRHSIPPMADAKSELTVTMNELRDKIYKKSIVTRRLLKKINYTSKIAALYKI